MDYWLAYFSTAILYIIPCIGLLSKKQLFKVNKISFFLILGLLSHAYFAYLIIFNHHKKKIYQMRVSGLVNSITGKKSFFRIND